MYVYEYTKWIDPRHKEFNKDEFLSSFYKRVRFTVRGSVRVSRVRVRIVIIYGVRLVLGLGLGFSFLTFINFLCGTLFGKHLFFPFNIIRLSEFVNECMSVY